MNWSFAASKEGEAKGCHNIKLWVWEQETRDGMGKILMPLVAMIRL